MGCVDRGLLTAVGLLLAAGTVFEGIGAWLVASTAGDRYC